MTIEVKAKHIQNGRKFECDRCPVALAVKEASGDMAARATLDFLEFNKRTYTIPEKVREWIMDFDGEEKVQPFTFEIDL